MKRIAFVMMCILLVMALAVPAYAQSAAQQIDSRTTVDNGGGCSVTLAIVLRYEEEVSSPVFPVPSDAQDVLLNGDPATIFPAASSRMVSLEALTGGRPGTYTFTISYHLSAVVTSGKDGMVLSLQLLNTFPFPVERLKADIVLPGSVDTRPTFSSSYYPDTMDDHLDVTVSGDTISLVTAQPLKDHEALSMSLPVDAAMFPDTARTARVLSLMDIAILLTVLLALGYYLLALRPSLPKRRPCPAAPDGVSPGELGLWLTGSGRDLSLLVVSWAQLGYLRIQVDKNGRVLLHKRMDMGNERSVFENRCYKDLFGRRNIVDATGERYAELCRNVSKRSPQLKNVYRPGPSDPRIFRILCALSALLSGILIAGAFAAYSTFLQIFLSCQCAVMAYLIQSGGRCLLLRRRRPLWVAGICTAIWLILGFWSGEWLVAVLMILFQFLSGILSALGGKRTELGQQALIQILSMRKFLCTASKQELIRLLRSDPGYFHEMAPYALALGVDKRFARRFAKLRLPECTYLIQGHQRQTTAAEWAAMLRTAVDKMDERSHRLFFERLTGRK